MKKVSTAALAAALVIGLGTAGIGAPAFAKKEEQPKGPNISNEVRTPVVAAQTALKATPPDLATAATAQAQAEAAAKTDYEKYLAQVIKVSLESYKIQAMPEAQRSDAALAAPLDALLANPATPPADIGRYAYARANIAYNGREYAKSAQLYAKARDAGYKDDNLLVNLAKADIEAGNLDAGSTDMDAAVKAEQAAGRKVPESWYRFMISRSYKAKKADTTLTWTRGWLANYGTKANWRDAIVAFGFQSSSNLNDRQLVDLYRLMYVAHALGGQKEWIDYGTLANKVGLATEGKAVIDEGYATKAIPAGNMAANDVLAQAKSGIAGDKPLATQENQAKAGTGQQAAAVGDAYLGARNYTKAAELYKLALSKGVTAADPVNIHLGIALLQSGDKAGAQAAFATVKTAPYTSIAELWTTYTLTPPAA